uniref:MFS domain-containing protein n=1 Tax=Steinernema glaseri TaxID=37863 RepID=A0A1I7Z9T0_9BILA
MSGGQVTAGAFGAPIFMRSDSELNSPEESHAPSPHFIYSAPAIPIGQQQPAPAVGVKVAEAPSVAPETRPSTRPSKSAKEPQPKNDRRRNSSIASSVASNPLLPRRKQSSVGDEYGRNRSEIEIRNEHIRLQQQYKKQQPPRRERRLTDIDFEGILKIIGGCNMWQITIYLMISAQQVPHAMFNLSVVYMMYQPDHWCKIPGFSKEYIEQSGKVGAGWDWEKALTSGIAFPYVPNRQRGNKPWHEQCQYYDLYENTYKEYVAMNYTVAEAVGIVSRHFKNIKLKRCKEWDYDKDVRE